MLDQDPWQSRPPIVDVGGARLRPLAWALNVFVWGTAFACVGALGLILMGRLAGTWPALEPVANLRCPLGFAVVGGAMVLFLLRRRRRFWRRVAVGALVFGGWGVYPALKLWWPNSPTLAEGAVPLRIGSVNLLFGIGHPRPVSAWMEAENLDVVGFVELKDSERSKLRWTRLLASWKDRYPYQFIDEHDYYGMAWISKVPLLDVSAQRSEACKGEEYLRPLALRARIEWQGRDLHLRLVHPPRPQNSWRLQVREEFLKTLATEVAALESVVVLGDFNSTEGSPFFRRFLEDANLQDSRQGHGYLPTWSPRRFWLPTVPLDHILVRGPQVLDRGIGPYVRSDHRPIQATLAWPSPLNLDPASAQPEAAQNH